MEKFSKGKKNEFNFGFEMFVVPGRSMYRIIRILFSPTYIYDFTFNYRFTCAAFPVTKEIKN